MEMYIKNDRATMGATLNRKRRMTLNRKWILGLTLVFSIALLSACGANNNEGQETQNNEEQETQNEGSAGDSAEHGQSQQAIEPELDNIPDVVAQVNGEEISKEEFVSTYEGQLPRAAQQSQMTGQEVDQDQLKQQIAEGMVGQELLIQEAGNRGIEGSEEEVNKTLDELVSQYGLESKDEFLAALEQQGTSEEEVMAQLETQTKVDQLISDEYGEMNPTEEELKEAYEQAKAQQEQMGGGSEIGSFEEVKPEIKAQVKNQKVSEATQKLIQKLREEADVTINL